MNKQCLLFSFLFIIFPSCALNAQLNLNFRSLRAQDGLSESTNAFISRDSRGYIWLSSLDGVNRFDGQAVKTYQPDNTNSHAVNGEIGQSQFWEDAHGNLWFCTYTALNCYIRNRDDFRSWQVASQDNVDYSFIHLSPSGQICFMANNQLFHHSIHSLLKEEKPVFRPVSVKPQFAQDKKFIVKTDKKGNLTAFYSYRNFAGGIHYWDIEERKPVMVKKLLQHLPNPLNIKQALIDTRNTNKMWLICSEGLYGYDIKTDRLIGSPLTPATPEISLNSGVWAAPDYMLISTNDGLLGVQPNRGKIISKFSSLQGKSIQELYLDPRQVLWASVKGEGVYYTNINGPKFEFLNTNGKVVGMVEDQNGAAWVAHESGTMSKYWHKKQIQNLTLDPLESIPVTHGRDIIATSARQVYLFNPNESNWLPVFDLGIGKNFSAYLLKNKGSALLCTSNGLIELTLKTPFTTNKHNSAGLLQLIGVSNLFYDHKTSQYFFSFNQKEIWIYRKQHLKWHKWKIIPMNSRFNHYSFVPSLNEYWIANSKGVLCINRDSGKSHWLKNQHGTIRQNIQSLAVLTDKVWLVGNFRLMQYSIADKTTQTYTWDDGLFASQFSDAAITTTRNGEIWIGGQKGINIFDPKKIKPNPNLAQVALQECKINDTPIQDRAPNEIKNLNLPWHQNNLFFHLVAIEYTAPKSNQLEYQLKGWEKSGNRTGSVAQVKYNRLSPGKYTLMVRAANNNGIWSPWQQKMAIEIRPPFWQTWPFIILVIVLMLLSIWVAIQLYIRAKLQKERMLSAQKDARIKEQQRILREVHDDLGSSLTQIQHIRRKVTHQEEEKHSLSDFEEVCNLSTDLFARLGEVIVNIDEGPIQLSQLLQKIARHARRYLNIQNNLDAIIEIPAEIPNLELSNETRQHLELSVKECLHNIVKHAQATQVRLRFHIDEQLNISIQDNGIGISTLPDQSSPKNTNPSSWQKHGNGLRNLRQRISELEGSITWTNLNPGTLVQIEIPLSK